MVIHHFCMHIDVDEMYNLNLNVKAEGPVLLE